MRALVTGISGFVGGHLTEHLVAEGDIVVGLSASGRWPAELAHLGQQARIERFDLVHESVAQFAEIIRRKQPEVIYHLAAQSNPQASLDRRAGDVDPQFLGELQPARGGEDFGSDPASHPGQLGGLLWQPAARLDSGQTKTVRCVPNNPYAASKAAVDLLGIQQLPGARHARRDCAAVQSCRSAAVAAVCAGALGVSGGPGGSRPVEPAGGRQPRRGSRLHRRARRRARLSACWRFGPSRRDLQPGKRRGHADRRRGRDLCGRWPGFRSKSTSTRPR